ncbi:hypothetical protein [Formosa sp. PL04]|uniref:hypothetical protein n=1 Tax=Formosa sp. PL04 TaxID=3081755 RepID=UPI0029816B73|nr:hypothetical protein [Formosa sp. PL04]MDW5291013.1 hypothetical protein [Formosa sp. PL04]
MKDIDNLIRDNQITPPLQATPEFTNEEDAAANKIFDIIKKAELNLLIPERFETPKNEMNIEYASPSQKHITLSFEKTRSSEHQKKVLDHKLDSDIRPNILIMHKIKVPLGYMPTKVVFSYQVYTENEESVQINFKIGQITKNIKLSLDSNTDGFSKTIHDTKNNSLFDGNLEINLSDTLHGQEVPISYLNKDNEIPFSIFIRESKHHSFHILIGCEKQKSILKHWPLNTYHQIKRGYKIQREKYERKFREQLKQFTEDEINDIVIPFSVRKKIIL